MRLGVIGYGARTEWMYQQILQYEMDTKLTAVCDIHCPAVRERMRKSGMDAAKIQFYTDVEEMLGKERLDGVMIGTRCSLHTEMAVKVLRRNIPLFLEKPVSTSLRDVEVLMDAGRESGTPVVVSFPLRASPIIKLIKKLADSGEIGRIAHVEAVNNVPYGGVYYHSWYRDDRITGGLFLQKATHDIDYINYLLDEEPVSLCAMASKQVFQGDRRAGLTCDQCEEKEVCRESAYYSEHFACNRPAVDGSYNYDQGKGCCFAVDTGNQDSGSILIKYASGRHVSYSQNFFARKSAGKRGAILTGYEGTIEFDFYTGQVKLHKHHLPLVQTYQFDTKAMAHFGGDAALAYNFIQVMRGQEASIAPLRAGALSAYICASAQIAADTEAYVRLNFK